jgi:uncharacterized protein
LASKSRSIIRVLIFINMKSLSKIASVLLIIGGLNWLLFAFKIDIGSWISGSFWATLMKIVYVLVGLSAIVKIFVGKPSSEPSTSPTM